MAENSLAEIERRSAMIAGLQTAADWLRIHDNVPVRHATACLQISIIEGDEAARVSEVRRLADATGADLVRQDRNAISFALSFGPVDICLYAATDEGRRRHAAEMSYSGCVTP